MPHRRESKYSARKVISLERQVKCLQLKLSGLSYEQIGKAVGISGKQAYILVARAVEELKATKLALAEDVVQLEIARQEALLQGVWVEAKKGSLKHHPPVQVIIQRLTALHGAEPKAAPGVQAPVNLQPGEADAIASQATENEIRQIEAGNTKALQQVLERVRGR